MLYDHNFKQVIYDPFNDILKEISSNYNICLCWTYQLKEKLNDVDWINCLNAQKFDLLLIVSDHYYNKNTFINQLTDVNCLTLESATVPNKDFWCPYWFMAFPWWYKIDYSIRNLNNNKNFLFSCLNRTSNPHKVENYNRLKQSAYYSKTLLTYHEFGINSLVDFNTDPLDYNNPAYLDSYVNIVVENSFDVPFVTEKTIKCLLAEQLFVIVGGTGIVNVLRDLGFDTYDDIINHEFYDSEINPVQRLDKLHKLLHEFQFKDWNQIYKDTKIRRENNRNLLLSEKLKLDFVAKLEDTINTNL